MANLIEVSPSGRATCKTCKTSVAKGDLRFGEEYASGFSDGMSYRWHHLLCAAKKLPYELEETLATFAGDVPDRAAVDAAITEAKKKVKPKPAALPYADRAPTGRAKCIVCTEAIAKDAFRVAIEREVDTGGFTTKGAGYLHPACVASWASENLPDADATGDFMAQVEANTRALSADEIKDVIGQIRK